MCLCNHRRKFQRILLIQNEVLRFSRHTHNLPRKNRQNIGLLHTGVARRYNSGHTRKPRRPQNEIIRRTEKLENAGYGASKTKSEIFKNKMKWLGHEVDEDGIEPNKEKVKNILELKHPENPKQLKSFLGAIQ